MVFFSELGAGGLYQRRRGGSSHTHILNPPPPLKQNQATNHLGRRAFFTTTDEEHWALIRKGAAAAFSAANVRRYYAVALRHAQGLAAQVAIAAKAAPKGKGVDVQEQVELMLLDVFLEGLFEVDLRRVNSEEVG